MNIWDRTAATGVFLICYGGAFLLAYLVEQLTGFYLGLVVPFVAGTLMLWLACIYKRKE